MIFWGVIFILFISLAGWVGFKMGQQVVIHEVRKVETALRFALPVHLVYDVESSAYADGHQSGKESAADMLDELCTRIDP